MSFGSEFLNLTLKDFTTLKGEAITQGWSEKEGVIHRYAKGGDIISREVYKDFELEWEWKITHAGNSGLKYFFDRFNEKLWLGLEYQMLDDEHHPDAKKGMDGNRLTASFYDIKAAHQMKPLNPVGEWNHSRVIAKEGKVQHYLNQQLVAEADLDSQDWKELLAKSKFKVNEGFPRRSGYIMLQDHNDETWFRNIKIRRL